MDKDQIQKVIDGIQHRGGKEFVIALLQQVKGSLFAPASPPELPRSRVSVKVKKARTQNIFEEIVECITAQNPKKRNFGLCLSERCFGEELFVPFCRVVENNKLLSNLSLVHCEFSSVACVEGLSAALKRNTSLTSFNLSHSKFPVEGFRALVESVGANTSITHLFLDNLGLNDDHVMHLADTVFATTKSLCMVDLSGNLVAEPGYQRLWDLSEANAFCPEIRLKDNTHLSAAQVQNFQALQARNLAVSHALRVVLDRAYTQISVNIRVQQTSALLGRTPSRGAVPASPGMGRTRARGGTIDASVAPTHILNATSASGPMEDCGNSESVRYAVGSAHCRGRRKDMEDAMLLAGRFREQDDEDLFCVFDGHGSQKPAIHAAKNISALLRQGLEDGLSPEECLVRAFHELDEQMKPFAVQSGTTAVVCWIRGDVLYTANVGDSRAVLRRGEDAIRLTVDHKPQLEGETERVESLGGSIRNNRVQGQLAVTRALGDHNFAGNIVSAEPYLTVTTLTNKDTHLLLACDGVFDVMSDDAAMQLVAGEATPAAAATKLKDASFDQGSTDNISTVVIHLKDKHTPELTDDTKQPRVVRGLWTKPASPEEEEESDSTCESDPSAEDTEEDSASAEDSSDEDCN